MKNYFILLLLLLSSVGGFAQKLVNVEDNSCGTTEATEEEMQAKFYYGNNDRLQEKYDSLAKIYGNVSSNSNYRNGTYGGEDNIWFRVPIKFWIYQWTSANSLEYPERSVKSMIWALNDAYRRNNIPVRFFTSCYQFVENQAAASTSRINDEDVKDLMSSNKEFAAINIHIMNNPSSKC